MISDCPTYAHDKSHRFFKMFVGKKNSLYKLEVVHAKPSRNKGKA
jgi:hypothetical protein